MQRADDGGQQSNRHTRRHLTKLSGTVGGVYKQQTALPSRAARTRRSVGSNPGLGSLQTKSPS